MSNLLSNAWTIAKMKSVPDIKRNPILLVILMLFIGGLPLVFVSVFGGAANLGGALVGAFVSSAPALALFAAAQDINFDNFTKLRQIFVSKPISPMSYVLGASLSGLIYSSPGIILFGALLMQRGLFSPTTALLSIGIMLLGWVVVSSAGFIISGYLINTSPYKMNSIINLLAISMVYLPPVYYPASALGSLSWITALIPISAAAQVVKSLAGLVPMDGLTLFSSVTLLVQGVLFTTVFVSRSRWREE